MCEYCTDGRWKNIRMALAAEAIGKFSVHAKADNPAGIEPFVEAAVEKFTEMICGTSGTSPCPALTPTLVTGVRKAWPKLTIEEKLRMALAAVSNPALTTNQLAV